MSQSYPLAQNVVPEVQAFYPDKKLNKIAKPNVSFSVNKIKSNFNALLCP